MTNKRTLRLLPHQLDFFNDVKTRFIALVGGFGSGKTDAFCAKTIKLAQLNVGSRGIICEPTGDMVRQTLLPSFEQMLEQYKIPFTFSKSQLKYELVFNTGRTEILCRSAENYNRARGLNLAFAGIDEIDTCRMEDAVNMWYQFNSRLRDGKVIQMYTTSTPEGFKFLNKFFVEDVQERYKKAGYYDSRIIHAKTADNPFLKPTTQQFINDLQAMYPAELIAAYLNGEFCNLTSGRVYPNFDRVLNSTLKELPTVLFADRAKYVLHVGLDFNVNKMSAICHLVDGDVVYVVDEIQGAKNTDHMIQILKERYAGFRVIIYPDASGNQANTAASYSDIALLRNAGFGLDFPNKNPFIKDRVASMNAMILNGQGIRRYFVNVARCPALVKTLEQQVFKNGQPDKDSNLDHPGDATGYFIHRKFPVIAPTTLRSY